MVIALPRIKYRGEEFFFDERLSELRNVNRPWDSVPLKDYQVWWIKHTGRYAD
jgi:hypothetical protein